MALVGFVNISLLCYCHNKRRRKKVVCGLGIKENPIGSVGGVKTGLEVESLRLYSNCMSSIARSTKKKKKLVKDWSSKYLRCLS